MTHLVETLKKNNFQSRESIKLFYETAAVQPINVYYFTYSSRPFNECIRSQFVFLIKSSYKNENNRRLLRTYFLKQSLSGKFKFTFKWVFFIGRFSGDSKVNVYDDVVQIDFIDSYLNNTLKLSAEIFWIRDHLCKEAPKTQRILFIDDDVFINFNNLDYLLRPLFDKRAIFGHLYPVSVPYRTRWSKWFVATEDYNNDFYPPYISGSTIITNVDTLIEISLAIPYIKYLPFDDVFIGIVAKKLGIEVVNEGSVLIDDKCGFMCKEDISICIAVHITQDAERLQAIIEKYTL